MSGPQTNNSNERFHRELIVPLKYSCNRSAFQGVALLVLVVVASVCAQGGGGGGGGEHHHLEEYIDYQVMKNATDWWKVVNVSLRRRPTTTMITRSTI